MDLKPYLTPVIKWWWLTLISIGLALGTSYYFTSQQPPIYHAKTTLLIGQTLYNPNPSGSEFFLSQQLASLYADIAHQNMVREGTKQALGIKDLPRYEVLGLPSGQLLVIDVIDTNPELAYKVANELANQLINVSPTEADPEEIRQAEFIDKQMLTMQNSIEETELQIAATQERLGKLTSAREIALAQAEVDALADKLSKLQATFANLAATAPRDQVNVLSVVEPASMPTQPAGLNPLIIMVGAALFAILLSGVAAYALEALDDRIRTAQDIQRVVGLPVLGHIAEMGPLPKGVPYVIVQPRSMIAEAFRTLRANLESIPDGSTKLQSVLVTSPEPSDGKTSVAVNLAMVIAQGGKKVILLDTDLRNPTVHNQLDISNQTGLAEVLKGELSVSQAVRPYGDWHVGVITAGNLQNGLGEKLNSSRMDEILKELLANADIVILDGPPMFLADSLLWSTRVDGVLMILRPGHTRKEAARTQAEQFDRVRAKLLGVVLNRVPLNSAGMYGSYRSYYPYYYGKTSKETGKQVGNGSERVLDPGLEIDPPGKSIADQPR